MPKVMGVVWGVLAAAVIGAEPVAGQRGESVEERPMAVVPVMVGAGIGSALGLVLGNSLGAGVAWEDGEDASGLELLVFAGLSSSLGAALGLRTASDGTVGFGEAMRAALVGMVLSGAATWAAHQCGGAEGEGLFVSYAVGQGAVAGVLAGRRAR